MTKYLDFEIHVAPGSGQDYPVVVLKSPAGETTGILRLHGHRNIAAAVRRNARDATRVLPLLGITSP